MRALKETDLKRVREEKDRIPQLEEQLQAAQEDNLSIMEATAQIYEENLAIKEDQLNTMEALATVYEQLLTLQNGGTA